MSEDPRLTHAWYEPVRAKRLRDLPEAPAGDSLTAEGWHEASCKFLACCLLSRYVDCPDGAMRRSVGSRRPAS